MALAKELPASFPKHIDLKRLCGCKTCRSPHHNLPVRCLRCVIPGTHEQRSRQRREENGELDPCGLTRSDAQALREMVCLCAYALRIFEGNGDRHAGEHLIARPMDSQRDIDRPPRVEARRRPTATQIRRKKLSLN